MILALEQIPVRRNDRQNNNTLHNDAQHSNKERDIQHKECWFSSVSMMLKVTIKPITQSVVMSNDVVPNVGAPTRYGAELESEISFN